MALQDVNCGILVCVDVWGQGEIFVRSFEDGVTACVLSLAGVGERAMVSGDLLRNDRFMISFWVEMRIAVPLSRRFQDRLISQVP